MQPRTKQQGAMLALAIVVAIGTFVVLLLRPPEEVIAVSDDAQLRLEGQGSAQTSALITRVYERAGPFTSVDSSLYRIEVDAQLQGGTPGADAPVWSLLVNVDSAWLGDGTLTTLTALRYDDVLGAWRVYPGVVDVDAQTLEIELAEDPSGLWGFGAAQEVALPSLVSPTLETLLAAAPPQAVGHRAFVAFAAVPDDFVLLEEDISVGGCGGVFEAGKTQTLTSKDLSVDGKTFRVAVVWEVGEGCEVVR